MSEMKDGKYKTEDLDEVECIHCVDHHLKHEQPQVKTNCGGCYVYVEKGVKSPPTQCRMRRPGWFLDFSLKNTDR